MTLLRSYQTYDERKQAIIEQMLLNPPGTTYLYSDLSAYVHSILPLTASNSAALPDFMNLQFVLEAVTGTLLDQLIHDKFTGPLGMKDSWFN
jgi:hypothetical protein